jgi:beta-phosphoglucomutase
MLEAAIFDMDGVIVDSHPIHKKAWRKFLELQGKSASEEDLNFIMDGRKRDEILRHFLGDLSDERIRVLGHEKEQLFKEEAAELKTISGLVGFLDQLTASQIKLGVASSGSSGRVTYVLDALQLRTYFETVVTGDHVISGKPDPSIFRLACLNLRVATTNALIFEDSFSGIHAAKAAGSKCIGVATNGVVPKLLEAGADAIIPDFSAVSVDSMRQLFR